MLSRTNGSVSGLRRMRKSLVLLICFGMVPLFVRAQDEKIILPTREATLKQAIDEVQWQTDYKVALDWNNLEQNRKVLFPGSQLAVKEVLDVALYGTGYTWKRDAEQILVIPAPKVAETIPHSLYSVMDRDKESLQQTRMKVVPDPLSKKEVSAEEIAKTRTGYWSGSNHFTDSLGLAVINYRVNKSVLEKDYMNNRAALNAIHRTFSNKDLLSSMDYVVVTSASSPEGNTAFNEKLAADRAMSMKSYLLKEYPFMDRDRIYTFSIGEDWTGLRKMVADDPATPYREEVLDAIDNNEDGNKKRAKLKSIGGGKAYDYLVKNMLPYLRGAAACMIYYKEEEPPIILKDTIRLVDTVYIDRIIEVDKLIEVPVTASRDPYYFAVKNNMLYDALLLPNLGIEFSLPKRWSIAAAWNWSWWKTTNSKHRFHRIQVGELELRKWLGHNSKTPLTGHFLGLYGMGGTYDLRWSGTGYLSDWSYSVGLDYGYSKPIGNRLNLEFNIALGFIGGRYKKYDYCEIDDGFPWKGTFSRSYFGPTKAGVSLVWLIGSGTNEYNKKK